MHPPVREMGGGGGVHVWWVKCRCVEWVECVSLSERAVCVCVCVCVGGCVVGGEDILSLSHTLTSIHFASAISDGLILMSVLSGRRRQAK